MNNDRGEVVVRKDLHQAIRENWAYLSEHDLAGIDREAFWLSKFITNDNVVDFIKKDVRIAGAVMIFLDEEETRNDR